MMRTLTRRLTAWALLLLFTLASSAAAAPARALSAAELDAVTAGVCGTCGGSNNPRPPTSSESWEAVSRSTSKPVRVKRAYMTAFTNNKSYPVEYTFTFNDNCKRIFTGGSISLARGLGISLNSVYNCAETHNVRLNVSARSSVTLYRDTMRYYDTTTYRLYLIWSDGMVENTGLTSTLREEHTFDTWVAD